MPLPECALVLVPAASQTKGPSEPSRCTQPGRPHTCSERLSASCTRTSSPALASSSLLSFSSWSLCSSSWMG